MRTRRLLVALVATMLGAMAAITATPTAQAATQQKYGLVGDNAILYCYNLEPYPGEVADTPQAGFATFQVNKDRLSVHLKLTHAKPNTDYVVRLLQGEDAVHGIDECWTVDTILHTNKQGNGQVKWNEKVYGERAQVIVDTDYEFGNPTYRATNFFTIP